MIVIISNILVLLISTRGVGAVGEPDVTLEFYEGEETQEADVRPGEHGIVTFPGVATVELVAGSNIQDVVLTLTGKTDKGWPATVNPDSIQMNPGNEAPFSVTVEVPIETSSSEIGTLTVTGIARTFPGSGEYDIDPIYGTIQIEQFFKFSMESNSPYAVVSPGDRLDHELKILNMGNGKDNFVAWIQNQNKLEQDDISVSLSPSSISIEEGAQRTIKVSVLLSDKKLTGTHIVEVEVWSKLQEDNEGTAFPKTYPFTLKYPDEYSIVENVASVGIGPILIIVVIMIVVGIVVVKKKRY